MNNRAAAISNAGTFNNGLAEDTQAHILMDGGALVNNRAFISTTAIWIDRRGADPYRRNF